MIKSSKIFWQGLVVRNAAAFLAIGLTTVVLKPFEQSLEIKTITLLYLLVVMAGTVLLGLVPGVLASFVAFLALNFYFIQPFYTFEVHNTLDLVTLIVFLIVSVVMSQLIGQARAGRQAARSREWEATRMYELISALAGLHDAREVAQVLADHTLETFHLDRAGALIEARSDAPNLVVFSPPGEIPRDRPRLQLAIKTAREQEGWLRLWFTHPALSAEEERLLEAFVSQGALSLERIRLAKGETKARILEESDRMKSSLLNSVSHELRSPLAAIKASVSSLRSGTVEWNSEARPELLATIEEETDHLNLLVGNLLDMSRIELGALYPQLKWSAIEEIARGVASKMRKQLQDHRLELDFPENLPLVPTDYVMIEQVFTNVISNSIKYAPAGSVIQVSAVKEHDFLHVMVSNQGPLVPEADLAQIFDKFHRVTQADRVTGTGLGLSICKGIVEAHGGKIWAENQDCCFVLHFTLPLALDGVLPEIPKELGDG